MNEVDEANQANKINKVNELNEVQIAAKKIVEELISVCEENQIRYFVLGGTLLGCVRHKGFIPWDDDIDIGFPRDDYERLLKILENNKFVLTSYQTDETHISYFAKLTSDEIKVIKHRGEHDVELSVWVDLFPIDGMPVSEFKRKLYVKRVMFYKLLYKFSLIDNIMYDKHRGFKHNLLIWFGKTFRLHKILNYKKILDKIDRLLKKYSYEDSEYVANLMGAWSEREIFPKSYYDNLVEYPFEDIRLVGSAEYDKILTQMYGDYMTPPDEGNRNHHNTEMAKQED